MSIYAGDDGVVRISWNWQNRIALMVFRWGFRLMMLSGEISPIFRDAVELRRTLVDASERVRAALVRSGLKSPVE